MWKHSQPMRHDSLRLRHPNDSLTETNGKKTDKQRFSEGRGIAEGLCGSGFSKLTAR